MHHPRLAALALAAILGAPATAAGAQEPQRPVDAAETRAPTALEARSLQVVELLNGEVQPAEIFTASFRAAVADAHVRALGNRLTAQFGRALAVSVLTPREGTSAAVEIRLERGVAKGRITIAPDEGDRISGLLFTTTDSLAPEDDTPARIAADLAVLPGAVNAWFGPVGGSPVIARGATTPLALGSAFKLYVLAALAEDVKAGRRKWTDVVPLTEKSYPSGQLQDWPQGAPVTLHTLASLMISVSDNTATDELIMVLGRERIITAMRDSGHANPAANDPFLTTRELFMLKADPALTAQWRSGDGAARSAVIGTLAARTDPPLEDINAAFANGPRALDVEWFASPADLARLLAHMRRKADPEAFRIMAINPSATESIRARWDYVGFKGGSEPGVMNLTWLLTDTDGQDWVLTLGWNNPAAVVDEGKLEGLAQRILLLPR
jgi:beta-lactamase class A